MSDSRLRRRPGRPPADEVPEGERRAHILRATGNLFERRAYAAVSIGDIAGEVGIAKAAIYHHFGSKDVLYTTVLCETLESIGAAIRQTASGTGSVAEKLHRLAEVAIL